MQFQNRLVITFAILACGFFFIQPVDAQETFPLRLAEDDSETNDSDDDKKHPAPPSNHTAARVTRRRDASARPGRVTFPRSRPILDTRPRN